MQGQLSDAGTAQAGELGTDEHRTIQEVYNEVFCTHTDNMKYEPCTHIAIVCFSSGGGKGDFSSLLLFIV